MREMHITSDSWHLHKLHRNGCLLILLRFTKSIVFNVLEFKQNIYMYFSQRHFYSNIVVKEKKQICSWRSWIFVWSIWNLGDVWDWQSTSRVEQTLGVTSLVFHIYIYSMADRFIINPWYWFPRIFITDYSWILFWLCSAQIHYTSKVWRQA